MTSDFLFPKQSFMRGIASIGNLNGMVLCNSSENQLEADSLALYSDWKMVGNDIREAINNAK